MLRLVVMDFKKIYLLINSLDICAFKSDDLMYYLSELGKIDEGEDCCRVSIIAGIDHIQSV